MNIAQRTADILLDTGAIAISPEKPFILTSGLPSPVYVDCRKLISFPQERKEIIEMMAEKTLSFSKNSPIHCIAGGETAGIPYGAWLADALSLPMVYVRKKPKGFGKNAQIEGFFKTGDTVLLVEDLATDGGSKILFIDALRKAEATVTDTIVVFHYGLFPYEGSALQQAGVKLHALATWHDVLQRAEETNKLPATVLEPVRIFLKNPEQWRAQHANQQ